MASASPNLERFEPVLRRIAQGEHVSKACKAEGVDRVTFWRAVDGTDESLIDPELRNKYARAREWQADARADAIAELTEWLTARALAGDITSEQVQAIRVAIDSEKWAASKLRPKVYGDRVEHSLTGSVSVTTTHTLTPDLAQGLRLLGAAHARRIHNTIDVTPALPAAATEADPPTGGV